MAATTPVPVAQAEPIAQQHTSTTWTFRPLGTGLTKTTSWFLWIAAGLYMTGSALLFTVAAWLAELLHGIDRETAATINDAADVVMAMAFWAYLITGVVFLIWFFQAYASAEALGATQRKWGAGWTVGSWFIPIAQFVIPKLVMNEVDRMSNPAAGGPPINTRWRRLSPLYVSDSWWVLFVLGILTLAGSRVIAPTATYEQITMVDGFGALLLGAAGIVGGNLVREIGARLAEPHHAVNRNPGSANDVSSELQDLFDASPYEWIRGYEVKVAREQRLRCLSCEKDVYFPAGKKKRHRTHRIAPLDA